MINKNIAQMNKVELFFFFNLIAMLQQIYVNKMIHQHTVNTKTHLVHLLKYCTHLLD